MIVLAIDGACPVTQSGAYQDEPPRWAQLIVGLANLLLRVSGWPYFMLTGQWPDWPLR